MTSYLEQKKTRIILKIDREWWYPTRQKCFRGLHFSLFASTVCVITSNHTLSHTIQVSNDGNLMIPLLGKFESFYFCVCVLIICTLYLDYGIAFGSTNLVFELANYRHYSQLFKLLSFFFQFRNKINPRLKSSKHMLFPKCVFCISSSKDNVFIYLKTPIIHYGYFLNILILCNFL